MNERQAWDRFLATGKVEDYLACVRKKESKQDESSGLKNAREKKQTKTVMESAGVCRSDGNGAFCGTGK